MRNMACDFNVPDPAEKKDSVPRKATEKGQWGEEEICGLRRKSCITVAGWMFDDEQEIEKNSGLQSIIFKEEKKKRLGQGKAAFWGLDVVKGQMLKRRLEDLKGGCRGPPRLRAPHGIVSKKVDGVAVPDNAKRATYSFYQAAKRLAAGTTEYLVVTVQSTEHRRGLGALTPQNRAAQDRIAVRTRLKSMEIDC
nr:hypothetical protein [Trichoderma asperellum]